MTYARARLWLGICAVGTLVLLSAAGLASGAPGLLFVSADAGSEFESLRHDGLSMAMILGAYAVLMFPFDFLGGYILPRAHDRPHPDVQMFLGHWSRGVLAQSAALMAMSLALLQVGRLGGWISAVGFATVAMLGLVVGQAGMTRLTGGQKPVEGLESEKARVADVLGRWGLPIPDAVSVVSAFDPGFTGGVTGLPGRETVVIPEPWLRNLPPEAVAVEVARRVGAVRSGSRMRGILVALVFNAVGLALSMHLAVLVPGVRPPALSSPPARTAVRNQAWPDADAASQTVDGLLSTSLWFTLWSFVGLLTLPTVSRGAVFAADLRAARAGVPAGLLAKVIRDLDRLQDDEPVRSAGVESIFHPIPGAARRIEALRRAGFDTEIAPSSSGVTPAGGARFPVAMAKPDEKTSDIDFAAATAVNAFDTRPSPGAWHAARMALYLSWAGPGWLSRAVHCNCGRPQLWVMLPGD